MKILIAGLGSIGRRHLRNLITLGESDIILYRSGKATLDDEELKPWQSYSDLDEALAQKPDGVIVSNPSALHLSVALPAARAGANLLIEKPVSDRVEGLDELQKVLNEQGKRAMTGFHFRFHPVLRQIKELLDNRSLGKVLHARVHWGEYLPDWHPWEDYRVSYAARADLGGGVVNTLSHPFDYLRWMLGEVEALGACTAHLSALELDVEDHADVQMRFNSGAMATVHLDYYQKPPSHRLEITCEEGLIQWDNANGEAVIFYADPREKTRLSPPKDFERNSMFLDEMRHFLRLCKGETLDYCSLNDGIRVQQMVETIKRSNEAGGMLLPLEW